MLRALTVWEPWAVLLCLPDMKDLDNRKKRTRYRGELAIHAGALTRLTRSEMEKALIFTAMRGLIIPLHLVAKWFSAFKAGESCVPFSAVVGLIDLVDCVEESDSPYFTGPFGWVRGNPRLLPTPVPCKGKQGIWFLPDEVEAAVRGQLEGRG